MQGKQTHPVQAPPKRDGVPVAVAMSGGVDSSTAAALLVQQGYQVIGLTMRLWAWPSNEGNVEARSGSSSGIQDARRVCKVLSLPFRVLDLEQEFRSQVVEYFCDSYALGRTPNPCLACNRYIKFGALLQAASQLGAAYLATGHYARIRLVNGKYQLLKGADREKDQSYVLYMLAQQQLAHVLFPLGDYTKAQVRALAAELGLPTAEKAESQDACFVSGSDYRAFLSQQRPATARPGPIFDLQGRILGQHQGIASYTVGQRQGLGITSPHPLYVMEVDPVRNALIVGPKAALRRRELLAEQVDSVAGHPPAQSLSVTAKIRYKAPEAAATLVPLAASKARVVFEEAQSAITPGQGVVFYQGDVLLGGGIISHSVPEEA